MQNKDKFNCWKGKTFSEAIDDFIEFLEVNKEKYYKDKDMDAEMLKQQNDLLHYLEFNNLKYHEIAKLGKDIKKLRENRREYKNEYLFIEAIAEFYKDMGGYTFITKLKELSEKLNKNANIVVNQHYNERCKVKNVNQASNKSTTKANKNIENLVSLNRIISKYVNILKSEYKNESDPKEICMELEERGPFSIFYAKNTIQLLANSIELYYKINGTEKVSCTYKTSDMLIYNENNKQVLKSSISIIHNNNCIHDISIDMTGKIKSIKKKKGGKRR